MPILINMFFKNSAITLVILTFYQADAIHGIIDLYNHVSLI